MVMDIASTHGLVAPANSVQEHHHDRDHVSDLEAEDLPAVLDMSDSVSIILPFEALNLTSLGSSKRQTFSI